MAYRLSPPRLLVFAAAVFLLCFLYDGVADWCQEKEIERSYLWSTNLVIAQEPQGLEGVVCPGVYTFHQGYNELCPSGQLGLSEWIFSVRDESAGSKYGLLCRIGEGAYEIVSLRKSSAKIRAGFEAVRETIATTFNWMFQLLALKPTQYFSNEDEAVSGFQDTIVDYYDNLWSEDFIDPETPCNCELFDEKDGSTKEEKTFAYWYLIYGSISCGIGAGAYLVFSLISRKAESEPQEVVIRTSLTDAMVSSFKAHKLLRANTKVNTFLMSCRKTSKLVYMKCLRSGCNRTARKKLGSELRALKMLKHPNIVTLVDTFHVGQRFSVGLEFAAYGSLDKIMDKNPECFELADKHSVYRQIIDAVAWMHSQCWVHLNIRTGSILVFDKWSLVKLTGFSRATKMVDGTFCEIFDLHRACCSPVVLQRKPYNPVEADIWCLRSLFLFLSTRKQLKPGQDLGQLLNIDFSTCDWKDNPSDYSLNLLNVLSQNASGEPFV